jgi:hypothetical protein
VLGEIFGWRRVGGRACGGDTVPLFRAPIPTMKNIYIYIIQQHKT